MRKIFKIPVYIQKNILICSGKKMPTPNKFAIVVIRSEGLGFARKLRQAYPTWDLWMPKSANGKEGEKTYDSRFKDWLGKNFLNYDGFVCIMAAGIVVRSLSTMIPDKRTGPGVVVCDEFGRHAISLLGGHEGGANDLAHRVASKMGCVPTITTGTESMKNYVLGVGCRKNATYESLKTLVLEVLNNAKVLPDKIRVMTTIDLKEKEPCILELSDEFHWPLVIFSADEINTTSFKISHSDFVEENIGVSGVCEPTALMASHYGKLVVPKTTANGCAVALVKEPEVISRRP
jgi:cobalt-precorrin 5A hydrolase